MRVLRAASLVFLLAFPLGAPAAFAAPARETTHPARQEAAGHEGLLGRLRGLLVRLWSPDGCRIDPLGACLQAAKTVPPPTAPASADEGCGLDPLGRCAASQ